MGRESSSFTIAPEPSVSMSSERAQFAHVSPTADEARALRRSASWEQGKEMALHANFTIDTGIQIYFCDPKHPWQRGTNENPNRLLRQYFPKRSHLKPDSQADHDEPRWVL
jgi:transposase, IS30 family